MRVSVIIPTHKLVDKLQRCLAHLARTQTVHDMRVTVVDNGSGPETLNVVSDKLNLDRDTFLKIPEKVTFARACNLGASLNLSADMLVFLNNDCYVENGWLDPMIEAGRDGNTIVGARLLHPDGSVQHAGGWIGQGWSAVNHRYSRSGPVKGDDPRVITSCHVPWVTGALLAIPTRLFVDLRGFDVGFHNGLEDVDLCLRAGLRGARAYYCAEAVAIHEVGQSPGRHEHDNQNWRLFLARWRNYPLEKFVPEGYSG